MALNLKTFKDFFNLCIGKFSKELPEIDPTIKSSFGRALSGSAAIAAVGIQEGIDDAVDQMFWQTADDSYLELIGEYDKTTRFDPTKASGYCAATGVLTTVIPLDTSLTAFGKTYKTLLASTVQNYTDSVALSFSGGIVTAVTTSAHSLSTGLTVTISGATPYTDYNGSFVITVLDENTFTYEITASPAGSDTGAYSANYALLDIESVDTGADTSLESGSVLSISVVDIDTDVYVGIDGIAGGFDQEDIEAYRERVGESHVLIPGIATDSMIKYSAKKISGNTRVYVIRPEVDAFGAVVEGGTRGTAGYYPALGEAVVYVLRDNDVSITPSGAILTQTKAQIISDGAWSTLTSDDNLFVLAPTVTAVNFVFTALSPDSTTMRTAIEEQLETFYKDNSDIAETVYLDDVKSFLRNIQDSTGTFLTSFTLTSPSADSVAGAGELFELGTVTFP